MREIKFKAFHKKTKQMYLFDIMWGNYGQGNGYIGMIPFGETLDYGSFFTSKGNREMIDPNDCEIIQYTGLKDKNGTEIYEGDKNQDGGVVIWNKDDASFSWEYIDEIMAMQEESEWCEVIGNIHQNPELL